MSGYKKGKYRGGKCLRGHDSLRYKSGSCIQCVKESAIRRREEISVYRKKYHAKYYQDNKERIKKKIKQYCNDNKEKVSGRRQDYLHRVKLDVLFYYSDGTMACLNCGISDVDVLCLDHINNDGKHDRVRWRNMHVYAKKRNYPNGLQVLCYNCNMKKEIERKRQSANGYKYARIFHG
jgi:hypothetical protein